MMAVLSAPAGSRTSADYTVVAEVVDAGGCASTSGDYSNDGSVGGVAGVASAGSPIED